MRKGDLDSAALYSICDCARNHQDTSDDTRGCSVPSFIPVQNVQNKNKKNQSGRQAMLCLPRNERGEQGPAHSLWSCFRASAGRFESRNPTARENKPERGFDSAKFLTAVARPSRYILSNRKQTPSEIYKFTALIFVDLLMREWD